MNRYPAPAQPIVAAMLEAAAKAPARAVAFQGAPGANSHIAVLQDQPDALPVPCYRFEDAIDAWRHYAQRLSSEQRIHGLDEHKELTLENHNDGIILAATSGAVNVRLGGAALQSRLDAVSQAAPGREPEVAHLRSIVGLVWRSVVLWMVLLALLTLARLLG